MALPTPPTPPKPASAAERLLDLLAPVPSAVNPVMFWGRVLFLALTMAWGAYFLSLPWRSQAFEQSFLHGINLVFHEAGHVLFGPFGRLLMFLGGSLTQVLVPLVFVLAFWLKQRNAFGAAICLAWVGQSLMDVAPYIADARIMDRPLLGEMDEEDADSRADRHDWHNILGDLHLLSYDKVLGEAVHLIGAGTLLLAFAWAVVVLLRQWRRRSEFAFDEV